MAGSVKSHCYEHAADPDASFCGECGKPLLRCMAATECKGLVNEDGLCEICVAPMLSLDKGAVREASVGGVVVLPLLFHNNSPAGRPIFISDLRLREGRGERKLQELQWERLDAGKSLPWSAQTSPIEHSGRMKLEISFIVTTVYRWRRERFLFVAEMDIVADAGGSLVINQTINASDGATAYAPIRLVPGEGRSGGRTVEPAPMALVRADAMERSEGVRGVRGGAIVSRGARLIWKGFAPGEAPPDGPVVSPDGMLALGRAPTRRQGGATDVQLLVRDDKGNLDEATSARISRRHLDLVVQDGQLQLHAAGQAGVRVQGRVVERDAVTPLSNGDVIDVLPTARGAISLTVRMTAHNGVVEEIMVQRTPGNVLEKRR